MKAKEFFKSTSFKSITVLIVIAVVLGGVLAILNDVLYVSPEEEVNRAVKKIYGREVGWEEKTPVEKYAVKEKLGEIKTVYLLEDGNYLVQSTGYGGYKNGSGTVTLWVVMNFGEGTLKGIEKVSYQSNESQSLMSKFGKNFYDFYPENFDGGFFDGSHTIAGATYTADAINNAVNMAVYYAQNALNGGAGNNEG